MQDESSVITQAVDDYGVKLAKLYGLSTGRFYQILEADNYGKTKRLIRLLATLDKSRVRLIKADMDALFAEVLGEPDGAEMHSELNDAIHAKLADLPKTLRLKESREAIVILQLEVASLEKDEVYIQNFGDLNGAKKEKVNV